MSNEKTEQSLILIVAEKKGGPWIRKDAGEFRRFLNDAYKEVRDTGRNMRVSPSRFLSEKIFSGFREKMEQLREVDDQIKNWTDDLDNCLDRAMDANKAGRYLDVIFWLSQINNRLGLVANKYNELNNVHEDDLADFYSNVERDESGSRKFKYDDNDYFTSGEGKLVQAGFLDEFGRKVTNWKMQQMYKDKIKKRQQSIDKLLTQATLLVEKMENRLSIMSKARSTGDIARYMAALSDVSKLQGGFEKSFKNEFNTHFSSLVDILKKREEQIVKETEEGVPVNDMPKSIEQGPLDQVFDEEQQLKNVRKMEQDPRFSAVPKLTDEEIGPVEPYVALPPGRLPPLAVDESAETKRFRLENQPPPETPAPNAQMSPQMESPIVSGPMSDETPSQYERFIADFAPSSMIGGKNNEILDPGAPSIAPQMQGPIQEISIEAPRPAKPKAIKAPKKKSPEKTMLSPEMIIENDKPQTQKSAVEIILLKKSHNEFYSDLEKAATLEDTNLLASMIIRYSEKIDLVDPDTSEELLLLAEAILNV